MAGYKDFGASDFASFKKRWLTKRALTPTNKLQDSNSYSKSFVIWDDGETGKSKKESQAKAGNYRTYAHSKSSLG